MSAGHWCGSRPTPPDSVLQRATCGTKYSATGDRIGFQKLRVILCAISCLTSLSIHAEPQFPPECPPQGTLEIVESPAEWADQCFAAINGRNPDPHFIGESTSLTRDIDLDGVDERLESRGTGNSVKQIYAFRVAERGFVYLGELNAHPSFTVSRDAAGTPTISYIYRSGVENLSLVRIQYRDRKFVQISSESVRTDAQ